MRFLFLFFLIFMFLLWVRWNVWWLSIFMLGNRLLRWLVISFFRCRKCLILLVDGILMKCGSMGGILRCVNFWWLVWVLWMWIVRFSDSLEM